MKSFLIKAAAAINVYAFSAAAFAANCCVAAAECCDGLMPCCW